MNILIKTISKLNKQTAKKKRKITHKTQKELKTLKTLYFNSLKSVGKASIVVL